MHEQSGLRLGVAGAGGRGGHLARVAHQTGLATVAAICDTNRDAMEGLERELGVVSSYLSYDEMLAKAEIHAVIVGTPMPLHVPQSIAALGRGLHVLCEVPAAVSLDECRELVDACKNSSATYAMAENIIHTEPNTLITALVREGLFGTVYFAEGEYIHELKELNETTPWRRTWQTGIDGITYGTHCLGPILGWFRGDRIAAVSCVGSGHHYKDPRGATYENQDTCILLAKLESGGLIKVRVDMLSDRPHAMSNFALQGTDGAYESARASDQRDRIWLRSICPSAKTWSDLAELKEHLPSTWLEQQEAAQSTGHGGSDWYTVVDFLTAIRDGNRPCVGVHEAMDLTLPGLVSQESISQGGAWMTVPNSRSW